jgi:hypothetical protein
MTQKGNIMTTHNNSDHEALLAIQELLDGVEWSPKTLDRIAAIMTDAGYRIRDLDDDDLDA